MRPQGTRAPGVKLLLPERRPIISPIAIFVGRQYREGGVFPGGREDQCLASFAVHLIQASNAAAPDASLEATKQAMVDKHVAYIRQAADAGAQIVCLQEIFYGPYFCAEQTTRWYDFTEPIPGRPHHPADAGPRPRASRGADRADL